MARMVLCFVTVNVSQLWIYVSVDESLRVYFSLTNEEIVLSLSVSSFLVLTFKKSVSLYRRRPIMVTEALR